MNVLFLGCAVFGLFLMAGGGVERAEAGIFTLTHYQEVGAYSLGVEPEFTLTNGGGAAANLKYQYGLASLANMQLTLGSGVGRSHFRLGTAFTYDIIPDIEDQPGLGLLVTGTYYRYNYFGQFEVVGGPFAHKVFRNGKGNEVEPFVAIPLGPVFRASDYHWQAQVALGAMFREEKSKLTYVVEGDMNLNQAETVISGGVSYTP